MNTQTTINWNAAQEVAHKARQADKKRFEHLIDEIDTSNPTCLSSADFDYYACELSDTDPSGKKWTANEIRYRMMENRGIISLDMLDTFGYENDDIIDFY